MNNKSILVAFVLLVAGCFASFGASCGKEISVVIAGWNADTGLITAVSSYVEKEYKEVVVGNQLSVQRCCYASKSAGRSGKDSTNEFKSMVDGLTKNTNDLVVVVASAGKGKPLAFATVINVKKHLALINIDYLATGITNATVKNVQYYWRVERETMRSVGLLMGKSPCFNPHCVLSNHVGLEGLDKKGRNLCPPCRFKKIGRN